VTITATLTGRPGSSRPALSTTLTPTSGVGLGITLLWFSLLVLIPLTAVLITATGGGWAGFWNTITNEQTAHAIRLTVLAAVAVTVVNVFAGTAIAWTLVRDRFFGKAALEILIDIQPAGDQRREHVVVGLPRVRVRHAPVRRPDGPAGT
jgi:sulfate transport system permease protein